MDFKCWTNSKKPVVRNTEGATKDVKKIDDEDVLFQSIDSENSQTLVEYQSQKLLENEDFYFDPAARNPHISKSYRLCRKEITSTESLLRKTEDAAMKAVVQPRKKIKIVSNSQKSQYPFSSMDQTLVLNNVDGTDTKKVQNDYDAFKSFIEKDDDLIFPLPLKEMSNIELAHKKRTFDMPDLENSAIKSPYKIKRKINAKAKTAYVQELFSQDSFNSLADTQTLINNNKSDAVKNLIEKTTNTDVKPKELSPMNTSIEFKEGSSFPPKETDTVTCSILSEFNSTQFDNSQVLKQIESEICFGQSECKTGKSLAEVKFQGTETSDGINVKIDSRSNPVEINGKKIVNSKSSAHRPINKDDGPNQIKRKQFEKLELSSPSQETAFLNAQFLSLKNEQVGPKLLGENTNLDDSITEQMLNIFKSSQYRKEVDLLFEKVETSICKLGSNQDDDMSNVIGTVPNEISWKDDSILANAILNISTGDENAFGDFIKKALMENGHNVATQQNIANATLLSCQTVAKNLGNFYGLPDKVKDLMRIYRGIDKLYDWQDECLNLPAIKGHKNLVYAMPTSGGKTLVAEILILREILCRKKNALFVLPFVAIVQEKIWSLSQFAVNLDFLIEEYAAGKGGYPPRKRRRKNCVYIATIEKALGLVNSLIDSGRLDELGLVVIDELHLVGDKNRGPTLEALLTKFICVQENIQIIGMSATIGNLSEICQFLNADVYTQNFRPVELTEFVKCGDELAKINWNAQDEDDLLMFARKAEYTYSEGSKKVDPDRLGGLVMEVVPENSCLIFCSSKKNCENVALLLCKVVDSKLREHKSKEKDDLRRALEQESGKLCDVLNISVPFGVAYHHSGLTSDERRLIEESFRTGVVSVICCTSTLAAGVNLPAKRVILRQPYIGKQFINLSRYKQMVGRAGRTGLGESGDSILITNTQDLQKVRDLLMSPMDQAMSFMHDNEEKGLRHLLLSCISLGIANTRPQLQNVVCKTLLGVQRGRFNVDIKKLTDNTVTELFKFGALQINENTSSQGTGSSTVNMTVTINSTCPVQPSQNSEVSSENSVDSAPKSKLRIVINNDSVLVVSKLGAAAIKGGLELTKAHILYEDLLHAQESLVLLDCLHLLYLITPYDVSEQIKPSKSHYYSLYSRLTPSELQTAKVLGLTDSCAVKLLNNKPIKADVARVLDRFYVTLMLYDLWNEVPVYRVAEKFQVARGLVQNLMTSSATFASNVVNFCAQLEEFWPFVHLLKGMCERLQHCCVRELVPLMELPSVKQNRAKQLYNAGYKTLASIARANPNDLVEKIEYMSRKVANQLIAASKLLLLEKVENLREEAEDVLDGIETPKLLNSTHL